MSPSKYVLQELPHRRQIFVSKNKKTEQAGLKKFRCLVQLHTFKFLRLKRKQKKLFQTSSFRIRVRLTFYRLLVSRASNTYSFPSRCSSWRRPQNRTTQGQLSARRSCSTTARPCFGPRAAGARVWAEKRSCGKSHDVVERLL